MTPEQQSALREQLYSKSIRELVEYIIQVQEELDEAKMIRRRFMMIRNICREPEEKRPPGRPRKGEKVV